MTSSPPPSESTDKKQYDTFASKYLSVSALPASTLETQLVLIALGDCIGLHILDLGGGNGLHARSAVAVANAASVDVVDISREMLLVGQALETSQSQTSGTPSRIRFFEADLTKPLSVTPLDSSTPSPSLRQEGYDIIMANWLLDHATSPSDLHQVYSTIAAHLKPHGGRFINVRVRHIHAPYMSPTHTDPSKRGKYGAFFKDIARGLPGDDANGPETGYSYQVGVDQGEGVEPFWFGATSLDETLELRDGEEGGVGREVGGLVQFWVVPPEEAEIVKGDPEYWADFVKEPNFAVVVARKS